MAALLTSACVLCGSQPAALGADAGVTGTPAERADTASAWGNDTHATGDYSSAWGTGATASGKYSTAFGYAAKATQNGALAFGYYTNAEGFYSTAWGSTTTAKGYVSTAFGLYSTAEALNSLAALGGKTTADAENSAAIGNGAQATLADAIALGSGAIADRAAGATGAAYQGTNTGAAWVSTHNAIAVGSDDTESPVTRQIIGVAAGTKDTDAVNVAQLKAAIGSVSGSGSGSSGSSSIGGISTDQLYAEVRPAADGNFIKKEQTTAANLTALDTQLATKADASEVRLTADGTYVKKDQSAATNLITLDTQLAGKADLSALTELQTTVAALQNSGTGTGSITPGTIQEQDSGYVTGDTVYNYLNNESLQLGTTSQQIAIGKDSKASGNDSIAIGEGNKASGNKAIAIGYGNQVTGERSGAFGDPSIIDGSDSYGVGNDNNIGGNNTFVLGNNVTANGNNTFVLGNNVTANVDNAVVLGNESAAEANAVSVGSSGNERQIKHVADGTDDTDAATVGQLKTTNTNVTNLTSNMKQLNSSINKLDSRINKVGAGAAALAALRPLETDDKFSMAMGVGNYRNATAAAIGLFYRPSDTVMVSLGGSMGNGENMINAGLSIALGRGGTSTSKSALLKKIAAQNETIAQQGAEIQALKEALARLEAKIDQK
ncbi:hypothetical protein SELR_03740 [Selenomonas ruminantium subsp. lactilytica TAM6421]|uniref:Head domain of trimeric autotransporter adhesin n=2 Tax=Selenomonas ruminantium TaxID=971 RepID=I0GMU5_SELRL|nr:hypothetical protein SELR_03740 [Selenomonas ruminantium subsp. lactilytica TAM6421]